VVARIVPRDTELRVFAFLNESHRAWIKEGDPVKLELSQFPFPEFGTLDSRILSVGLDFASAEEIRAAMGEGVSFPTATFKVELEVIPALKGPLTGVKLKPGMRVNARFTLRRQSPISFVLEPGRRWMN
jgi:multidrug efflux pump subunit AcrA (membrane-fusion protein)